jgi:hypothetical protein
MEAGGKVRKLLGMHEWRKGTIEGFKDFNSARPNDVGVGTRELVVLAHSLPDDSDPFLVVNCFDYSFLQKCKASMSISRFH